VAAEPAAPATPDYAAAEKALRRLAGLAAVALAIAVLVMVIDQQIKRAIIDKAAAVGRQLVKAETLLLQAERMARDGTRPDPGPDSPGPGDPGDPAGVRGGDLVDDSSALGTPPPVNGDARASSAVGWPGSEAERPGGDG